MRQNILRKKSLGNKSDKKTTKGRIVLKFKEDISVTQIGNETKQNDWKM